MCRDAQDVAEPHASGGIGTGCIHLNLEAVGTTRRAKKKIGANGSRDARGGAIAPGRWDAAPGTADVVEVGLQSISGNWFRNFVEKTEHTRWTTHTTQRSRTKRRHACAVRQIHFVICGTRSK